MRYFLYCRKSSEAEDRQVQSLESQRRELSRRFGDVDGIEIIEVLEESRSAQSLGRPVFKAMIARIEAGEAEGIVAWAPDRLARNPVDGGHVIHLLDRRVLRDLKFATYTFENNSQGKFMLQIMFGQSKYYSDALSENVLRGNRTKIENGWRPNLAPLGYLNDRNSKTIIPDPLYFPLIRKIFDHMLSGRYTPRQLAELARDEWQFRTPVRRKIGGVPLAMSSIYKILSNPFYAGVILWNGQTYPGKHTNAVTIDEFNRVRAMLQSPSRIKPRSYSFPFTGLIRCAACGRFITAEHKTNRHGHRYVYYHCIKHVLYARCPEPSVETKALEAQVEAHLQSITLPGSFLSWLERVVRQARQFEDEVAASARQSLDNALAATQSQLSELTDLRLRRMVSDEEFTQRREALQREILAIEDRIDHPRSAFIEPLCDLISVSKYALDQFRRGNDDAKRAILKTTLSNPLLSEKILNAQAAKPFVLMSELAASTSLLAQGDQYRTLRPNQVREIVAQLQASLAALPDQKTFVANLRALRSLMEPETKKAA
ncbi:MAG: Resolvase domain [Caulobacteraceae bacterium]|nr:Resolvase domain [Caulobacteraceae bacterium]